jgi:AcrR family transcriptional regulator
MNRIAEESRPYRSTLRAEQAEGTKERILEATLRLMADGLASFSVPAVAREAGVSVPTVYRHFRTKGDLLAALYPYVLGRSGLESVPDPTSLDDLRDGIRAVFERLDAVDDLARAAWANPIAEEARRAMMPSRYRRIHRLGESIRPRLSDADHDRITRLLLILTSSGSLRLWRDHLGCSVDEAADDVEWVARAMIAAATGASDR